MSSRYNDWTPTAPCPPGKHQPKLVHGGIPMWHIECELCQRRDPMTKEFEERDGWEPLSRLEREDQ